MGIPGGHHPSHGWPFETHGDLAVDLQGTSPKCVDDFIGMNYRNHLHMILWMIYRCGIGFRFIGMMWLRWTKKLVNWVYPLVNIQKTSAHGHRQFVDLPIKNGVIFPWVFVNVYQRAPDSWASHEQRDTSFSTTPPWSPFGVHLTARILWRINGLPSGYLTVCHGKSLCLRTVNPGKPSISMGHCFHGYVK